MNNEGAQPDETADIQVILADLDAILSGTAPAEGLNSSPATPPPAAAKPPPLIPAPVINPPPSAAAEPASSIPAPVAKPPPAVQTPPSTQADVPESKPSRELKIELSPRVAPVPSTSKPTLPTKPAGTPPQTVSSYKPPLEIDPGGATPAAAAPPVPASGKVVPAAAAAPVPTPPATPAANPEEPGEPIPENIPKTQIRRVAVLFGAGERSKCRELIHFLDSMALHFTKKPMYLRKCLVLELIAQESPQAIYERIKASGAVGVVGILSHESEAGLRSLEGPLSAASLFFRWIPAEDIAKRSAAVDLLVDVTLLSPE